MILTNLRIQNFSEPIGIDSTPRLAWEYHADEMGDHQCSYRITVATDPAFCEGSIVYDSGLVFSSLQSAEAPFSLANHTQYYFRVETQDENGRLMVASSSFVTGILKNWNAQWISANSSKPFYAAQHFWAKQEIKEAFCSVCGLGQFVLTLNQNIVGDHIIDPGWTDYHKQVQYVTFDVTKYIHPGHNDIVAEIGAGWYLADAGDRHHYTVGFHGYQNFGSTLPFLLELTVRYVDGSEDTLFTNADWKTCPSPTTLANIYGSEDYDARLEPETLNPYDSVCASPAHILESESIPRGQLTAMSHPPVKILNTYSVQSITACEGGYIYDFGQNMSGLFEIFVKGKRGQTIKMTPVEKLTRDGDICQSCNAYLVYTLKGDENGECWRPRFTYSAGRWLKIECLPADGEEGLPQMLDVKAHFISSSAPLSGVFTCSDERCNKLLGIIEKAIESNLNHVHTDCPTVERLGWLEISHLMAPSIMYFKDVDTLWSKILRDICEAQYGDGEEENDLFYPHFQYKKGMVTAVAPRYAHFVHAGTMGSFWDIVPWGSTLLLGPLQQFRFYGNEKAIATCYEPAKAYMDFLTEQYDNYNHIYQKSGASKFLCHGLGDWGVLKVGTESRENVETAFFYHDLRVLADIAEKLNRPYDKEGFLATAARVCNDYNNALLRQHPETGDFFYNMYSESGDICMVQTNQALPLYFGMVPDDKKESVIRSFLRTVSQHQINSGEIGLRYVLQLLNDLDQNDIVYDMIMQPEHPSYIRFIDKGETTLPEYWEDDARSHNHTMMGHIYEWFYNGVAGITSEDGFRHIRIAPRPPRKLKTVHCEYHGATGSIRETIKMTDVSFEMELILPANTTTVVEIPSAYASLPVICNDEPVHDSRIVLKAGGRYHIKAFAKKHI